MLAFGHAGITLGTVLILQKTLHSRNEIAQERGSTGALDSFAGFISGIDLRILLVGSLLPDIIDKPLGLIFFREAIDYGRIYAHTLLFLTLITIVGILLYRLKRRKWLLTLAFASAGHLVLDLMWKTPAILFWPLLGTSFPREDSTDYLAQLITDFLTQPDVLWGEVAGALVALVFGIMLLSRKNRLRSFFLHGRI
jgi:hypothetical protein